MNRFFIFLVLLLFAFAAGCVAVDNGFGPEQAPSVKLGLVKQNPEAYKGMDVLWGGKILKVVNKEKGTLLEVLEQPLGHDNRPLDSDSSEGRFIVSVKDFIDPAIYQEGRELTAKGAVAGVKDLPLGEITYKYVLVKGAELKLWKKRPQVIRVYHTGDAFYGPRPAGPGAYWYWGPYYWW